jgi:hypothetical protein
VHELIIRLRTQNEMVDDLQMGIRLVDRPEIEEVFQYARLLPEENHLRVARCSREKEHCTAAKEDLDADGGPFNIHTLFSASRPAKGRDDSNDDYCTVLRSPYGELYTVQCR